MRQSEDESGITPGSGNIFADLDLHDPEERLAKARLASSRILDVIEARGWTPGQAAEALALSEAEASGLFAGMPKSFSVARLTKMLGVVERGA